MIIKDRHHKNKRVVFYYDHTALNGNYAVNDHDFRWVIVDALETHGWTVEEVYIGRAMAHHEKHLLINRMLGGLETLMPMFNETNNEDLLISIQTAGVYTSLCHLIHGITEFGSLPAIESA